MNPVYTRKTGSDILKSGVFEAEREAFCLIIIVIFIMGVSLVMEHLNLQNIRS